MNIVSSVLGFLRGKKTYIVAGLSVLIGVEQVIGGDMSFVQFVNSPEVVLILGGLGLGSVRAAISKVEAAI